MMKKTVLTLLVWIGMASVSFAVDNHFSPEQASTYDIFVWTEDCYATVLKKIGDDGELNQEIAKRSCGCIYDAIRADKMNDDAKKVCTKLVTQWVESQAGSDE